MGYSVFFTGKDSSNNSVTITLDIAPEQKIDFKGPRSIARQDIPGYRPGYQDMGYDERTASWQGVINDDDALATALNLQNLMDSGQQVSLVYGNITATTLIKEFNFQYYRTNYVRYTITLLEVDGTVSETNNSVSMPQAQAAIVGASNGDTSLNGIQTIVTAVLQGDNLRSITARLFGNPSQWSSLAQINGLKSASIPAGTNQIQVPSNASALSSLTQALSSTNSTPAVVSNFVPHWEL